MLTERPSLFWWELLTVWGESSQFRGTFCVLTVICQALGLIWERRWQMWNVNGENYEIKSNFSVPRRGWDGGVGKTHCTWGSVTVAGGDSSEDMWVCGRVCPGAGDLGTPGKPHHPLPKSRSWRQRLRAWPTPALLLSSFPWSLLSFVLYICIFYNFYM